jgi:hypothetical protein
MEWMTETRVGLFCSKVVVTVVFCALSWLAIYAPIWIIGTFFLGW